MFRCTFGAVFVAAVIGSASAEEKLSRVEVGKLGKAATAFVEVANKGSGTAFCVHPSGLFITNEHVIRGAEKAEITLVLNPALEDQRILHARVVRVDKEHDLALLRVEGAENLPSLSLGSVKGVAELADVVAFGFPLGRLLSPDRKEYPAISVNAGRVTALRHKNKELQQIQIDVALTFGNSGGPVLDENGKVIGVVVSGVAQGKGINQAIPVSHLERFLSAPEIVFAPPELTKAILNQPMEFKARVVSFVPKSPEPSLRLVLQAGDSEAREFAMKKQGGEFVTTAAPVSGDTKVRLEISVRLGMGAISGWIDDAVFKVNDKPVRLRSIKRITFRPKPVVLLADGKTLEGAITGLGAVDINLGDQKIKTDLMKAAEVQIHPADEVSVVTSTIIAAVNGKEIARVEVPLRVRDYGQIQSADPSSVQIKPPALGEAKVVKRLPEVFSDVVAGGGGRYLIFNLPKLRQLAVFDMNEAKIVRYIPLAEDKAVFTAGLEKVVIGLPGKGAIERWNLATGEREATVFSTLKEDIKSVQMGHGSHGPVVVNGIFMDLATFKPLSIVDGNKHERIWEPGAFRMPSGDGTVFGAWNTHYSPDSADTFVLEGDEVKRYGGSGLHHVVPGPDGNTVFTARGILSRTLKRSDPDDESFGYCLPAMRGPYFLSLTSSQGGKGGGFTIYMLGQKRAVAKLDQANHGLSFDGWDREVWGPWRRVFFVPDANVIAVLPASNDQVVLHQIDVAAALEKSGLNYLLVTSAPPPAVKAGMLYSYPIAVKAKNQQITYTLDLGPKGMEVSKAGVVTWKAPAEAMTGEQEVILTIRDGAGQEIFHTFKIRVTK